MTDFTRARDGKETAITYNAEDNIATVDTYNPVTMRQLRALAAKDSRVVLTRDLPHCVTAEMPKKAVKFRLSRNYPDDRGRDTK